MKKLCSLPNLPYDIILCTVDVFGLHPNIPHEEVLSAMRQRLDLRQEKDITTSTLVELTEVVLKNNSFSFKLKNFKAKAGYSFWYKICPTV